METLSCDINYDLCDRGYDCKDFFIESIIGCKVGAACISATYTSFACMIATSKNLISAFSNEEENMILHSHKN